LGRPRLAQLKINVFNMIAAVCSLILVVYAWLMFLPIFKGLSQYSDVQNIVILITVLLIAVSIFQFYMAIQRKEPKPEDQGSNLKTE
jgi:membrane protein DedA with SNARE-associated domain